MNSSDVVVFNTAIPHGALGPLSIADEHLPFFVRIVGSVASEAGGSARALFVSEYCDCAFAALVVRLKYNVRDHITEVAQAPVRELSCTTSDCDLEF